jgi:DNA-binding transcriptional ArsR family regulator
VFLLHRASFPKEVPIELRKAVKGFDHPYRQTIIAALAHGRNLSFTELAKLLKLSKGKLWHHLDILLNSGLVKNFSKAEFKGPYDSYYSLSSFGEAFVDSLFSVLRPEMKLDLRVLWSTASTFTTPAISFPDLGGKIPTGELQTVQVT